MATDTLQTQSTAATELPFPELYVRYRVAKAEMEATFRLDDSALSDEQEASVSACHANALNAMLLAPASSIRELAIKIEVFRDEEIEDNWRTGKAIVAQLATDAKRLEDVAQH